MSTAVAIHDPDIRPLPTLLRPIAKPPEVLAAQNETRELIAKTLKDGHDYGVIPGTDKPTLLKPGAEHVVLSFGCTFGEPEIVERECDHDRAIHWVKRKKKWNNAFQGDRSYTWDTTEGESIGLYRYVVRVAIVNRATGEIVGYGIGSCSSMEAKYVENPRETENTVLKIARKRAMIDGTLTTFGLSDQFTQDLDDADDTPRQASPVARRAPVARRNAPVRQRPRDEYPEDMDHGTALGRLNERMASTNPDGRETPRTSELTYAQACAVRVKGEPLGDRRNTGLHEIHAWATKTIEEKGDDERLAAIAAACTLILAGREKGELTEPPRKEKPAKAEKASDSREHSAGALPFDGGAEDA